MGLTLLEGGCSDPTRGEAAAPDNPRQRVGRWGGQQHCDHQVHPEGQRSWNAWWSKLPHAESRYPSVEEDVSHLIVFSMLLGG